jgi:hypothetical protein
VSEAERSKLASGMRLSADVVSGVAVTLIRFSVGNPGVSGDSGNRERLAGAGRGVEDVEARKRA